MEVLSKEIGVMRKVGRPVLDLRLPRSRELMPTTTTEPTGSSL